ncbi:hypothetical protein NQ314_010553 [Rhamnusium bicolor]|uniref:Uncharacterized protein n=1 Tax=Rhamnusium bicolor TaxID=1586634 RepID=A0AAV8XQI5_9CUCU|nr:hypothetical protein NQ314_010553 [Rhamnusium bicolor]
MIHQKNHGMLVGGIATHSYWKICENIIPNLTFFAKDVEIPSKEYVFMGYDDGATMHLDFINRLMWQAQLSGSKSWLDDITMNTSMFYGKKLQTKHTPILTRVIENADDSEDSLLSSSDLEDELVLLESQYDDIEIPKSNLNIDKDKTDSTSGEEDQSDWEAEDYLPLSNIINRQENEKKNKKETNKVDS